MGRWDPDARERLATAAVELFAERGFDQTTVPEITARAGLTTRTFFRHFADKREVLFGDESEFAALATALVADAPAEWSPAEVIRRRLPTYAAQVFGARREDLRRRRAIVAAHPALQERELRKMAGLTAAVTEAFRDRGADELTAALVAETAVGVMRISIARWLTGEPDRELSDLIDEGLRSVSQAWRT